MLEEAFVRLKPAGAEALILCTNTMHMVSDGIERATQLPLIHIADATAERIKKTGFWSVGLLGTRFTMEKDFYKSRLADEHGLTVLTPDEISRDKIHSIIYTELCNGVIREESRKVYLGIIKDLARAGAECLILGCTEIGLLINETGSELPVFDTTVIHATAAVDWAMHTDQTDC